MTNRKKTMLMLFVDYLLCLLLQMLGVFLFSWVLNFSWGYVVYSIFFCSVLFGMMYVRVHNAAKRDLRNREKEHRATEGLIMAAPVAGFNLLLIVGFVLIRSNIIPLGNVVMSTSYSFPDNAPRVATEVLFIDYLTPFIRFWFSALSGFFGKSTRWAVLLIMPLLNLAAGYLGYLARMKKFFLADKVFNAGEKVKEKFNE